jgi:hypothetical protein
MTSLVGDLLSRYDVSDVSRLFSDARLFVADTHESTVQYLGVLPKQTTDPKHFLGEFTWVIFASGFNTQIIYGRWGTIRKILSDFDAEKISERSVISRGMKCFSNAAKWRAVTGCAKLIRSKGWEEFSRTYLKSVDAMEKLPRIGGITKYHLARNLGFDVVKPDVHLTRAADYFGFSSAHALCTHFKASHPEGKKLSLGQIDFVLWCYLSHLGKIQPCCFKAELPTMSVR